MANELKQILEQIDFHRAARRKALKEAAAHDKAECRLLRNAIKEHGDKLGLDGEVTANSFAPKDDN